jgi:hypothetical protein
MTLTPAQRAQLRARFLAVVSAAEKTEVPARFQFMIPPDAMPHAADALTAAAVDELSKMS